MITKQAINTLCKSAGVGFMTGQLMAASSALHHSIVAPTDSSRIKDFFNKFIEKSQKNGIEMATMSVLQSAIDPIFKGKFNNQFTEEMVSGAVTGSILNWRNGERQMIRNAASGAAQSLILKIISQGVGVALEPLEVAQTESIQHKFFQARNEYTFKYPHETILNAFSESK